MTSAKLTRGVIVFALIAIGSTSVVGAQTDDADPHHPEANSGQATQTPDASGDAGQDQGTQSGQFGMMGRNMMHPGMMGGMPMRAMRGHMMKIMFAIADADGDGALSFEEVSTIHKRIFDRVDADKNAKVTQEEMQTFMRE
ncbi:EF-hand domain-containing protein [Rhizobium herbae]|uniref:EF-hand domain-containing protein n=1 Tax=Rhizobium herbae TaxID=508661 RepID=A0ABS7H540_9HYPH|nr:EF-hand domain-containing protein [Rhizobium herbae]MBW9062318.1 EF-hand domain-containing protein [Rhizobium herbae]